MTASNPTARAVGTTVAVKDLFKTLPVRHKVHKGAADLCNMTISCFVDDMLLGAFCVNLMLF